MKMIERQNRPGTQDGEFDFMYMPAPFAWDWQSLLA
jgi:hypothetical protein